MNNMLRSTFYRLEAEIFTGERIVGRMCMLRRNAGDDMCRDSHAAIF
ncbi:MAG: hypothetical protein ACI9TP_002414, partial [Candidatus Azotimanducaceae bacterium]